MASLGIRAVGIGNFEENPAAFVSRLDVLREAGCQALELLPEDFDLIVAGRVRTAAADRLAAILNDTPFRRSLHVPLRLNLYDRSDPDLHRQVLLACLELCDRLGMSTLVHHPGRFVDPPDFFRFGMPVADADPARKQRLVAYETQVLREVADLAPSLTIAIENMRPYADCPPHTCAERMEELTDMVAEIDRPNVRIALDTGHLLLAATAYGFDALAATRQALPWIVHTHLHDNHGIVSFHTEKDKAAMLPFGRGDEHLPPGEGVFPFPAFFRLFKDFDGVHIVELSARYAFRAEPALAHTHAILEAAGSSL